MLFTFPSRYLSAIGHKVVFRLTRWSWQIHTGFHGPGATREQRHAAQRFRLRGSHPLRRRTHHDFDYHCTSTSQGRQTLQTRPTTPDLQPLPGITQTRFSHLRFRSPLLTESLICFLFLRVLRCFTSPRSLHTAYTFSSGYHDMTRGGFPHSDILGSQFGCQLPEA